MKSFEERMALRKTESEKREIKDGIRNAFKELRKQDIKARMNFSCCGSCGISEIWADKEKKGVGNAGYVFYHQQSNQNLEEYGRVNIIYSGWQDVDDEDLKYRPEKYYNSKEVGEILAKELREQGLLVEWDGDPAQTVEVIGIDEEQKAKKEEERRQAEKEKKRKQIRQKIKKMSKENSFELETTIGGYKESIVDLYGCTEEEAEAVLLFALESVAVDVEVLKQVDYLVKN